MFTWANLIAALLNFASKLIDLINRQASEAKAKAMQQKAEADAKSKADTARDAAIAEFDANGLRNSRADPNCRD
jgi:hypothetical protein